MTRARALVLFAAAALLGVVVALPIIRDRLAGSEGSPPFHIEAVVADHRAASAAMLPRTEQPEEQVEAIRWWYAPPGRWRWELDATGPDAGPGAAPATRVTVADGERLWRYHSASNTYCSRAFAPEGQVLLPPPLWAVIGPSAGDDIDSLLAALRGRWEGATATQVGDDVLLDRPVAVIEYAPVWFGGGSGGDSEGGVGTLWVDPERMLILRHVVEAGDGTLLYEVTVSTLDYGVEPTPDRLAFTPPPGATEAADPTLCNQPG